MASSLTSLLLVALTGCSSCADSRSLNAFHVIGSFHPSNVHALYPSATYFVVASDSVLHARGAVLAYAQRVCVDEDQVCSVLFWSEESKAAKGFPISEQQTDAIVASYSRNRSTGTDGLRCYRFGPPRESCRR
jgi:hypothetical protein